MSGVGPVTGQGIISTQVERTQADVAAAPPPPPPAQEAPPPPPPAESGRGMTVDTSA